MCAYAPQTGLKEEEKRAFFSILDDYITSVEDDEILLLGGDFNAHVGSEQKDIEARKTRQKLILEPHIRIYFWEKSLQHLCHGNHGYKKREDDGRRLIHFANVHNLILVNTIKSLKHPSTAMQETFNSGKAFSQVDFWLLRRGDLALVHNYSKVIANLWSEGASKQLGHRMILADLDLSKPTTSERKERMKW